MFSIISLFLISLDKSLKKQLKMKLKQLKMKNMLLQRSLFSLVAGYLYQLGQIFTDKLTGEVGAETLFTSILPYLYIFKSNFPHYKILYFVGAIFGALEVLVSRSVSRETYQATSIIPDWVMLLDAEEKEDKFASSSGSTTPSPPHHHVILMENFQNFLKMTFILL